MATIMVGASSAMCALTVPEVPNVGDKVEVREDMIVWVRTGNAYIMVGDTFELSERFEDFDTGTKEYGRLPWFGVQSTRK